MEIMNKLNNHLLVAVVTLTALSGNAREKYGNVFKTAAPEKVMAGCSPAQSSAELAVNNVRTIIYSGSDMWWDLFGSGNAWYLVPKVEDRTKGPNSNFAGNVWFGGLDVGGQLKIAAQTYRQSGVDFWTGPLSTIDASTTADVCQKYDKIFKLTRSEVDNFVLSGGPITTNIKDWPGNGDISLNHDPNLAPYVDKDGSGTYEPEAGDYPYYDIYNEGLKDNLGVCKARVFGDETLWWVYNDNGSNHVSTGGKAIGMEIRAQAFAFKTTDEINNMTFYNYQLINRSSFALLNTYMTVWTDADLGYYKDDYIGCDVKRGLGYIYNGDSYDESVAGTPGYGNYVPALGCDFFQGPINTNNGIDDNGNGVADEPGEQMGMTKFLYFNNSFPGVPLQQTDPQNATQYYQYMTGFWRDGTPFTCGGNAYGGTIATSYVYPGDTYPTGPCGVWSEGASTSGLPNDRRFMQSSGPFKLEPGAVNFITVGLPWARTTSTDPTASIPLLKIADDKAQALFDNCFRVLSGPEAPDMTIQEMDNELILYFSNKPGSNNYLNKYKELDVSIIVDTTHFPNPDKYYHFEGFKVYQLKNNSIIQEELNDPSKAKLVFNCDIANGITRLINYEFDPTTGGDIPRVKVDATDNSDKGIQSSFHFTQDAFSSSQDKKVINNKEYYFFCVAYAYNEYGKYKEDVPYTNYDPITGPPASTEGQKRPYLEGRKSKKAFGIPHNPAPEKDGTVANSVYGYGPKITRIEGQGNGGNYLDLTAQSVNDILRKSTGRVDTITYENGRGPLKIKVVDPLNVPNSNFSFAFINRNWNASIDTVDNIDPCKNKSEYHINQPYNKLSIKNTQFGNIMPDSATWVLKDLSTNKSYYPCKAIKISEEYYFQDLGLSVTVGQSRDVAEISNPSAATDKIVQDGDIISGSGISYSNSSISWLGGIPDTDGNSPFNWIRAGNFEDANETTQNDVKAASDFLDPNGYFENVIGGTWSPYVLAAASKPGLVEAAPGYSLSTSASQKLTTNYDIRGISSVDIVFTKDKNNWTRCLVLEECDEVSANPTGSKKLEPRRHKSVDKQGIALGEPGCNIAEASLDSVPGQPFQYGLSWFPGYAINLETGERLNIAFGEDSYQTSTNPLAPNNGDDMMWNPTSNVRTSNAYPYAFGGRHYIYVFGHNRTAMTYSNVTGASSSVNGKIIGTGTYANFADFAYTYKTAFANNTVNLLHNIWTEAMWVNMPVLLDSRYAFKNPTDMPCDAKVSLRVRKPYKYGMSGVYSSTLTAVASALISSPIIPDLTGFTYTRLTKDLLANPQNNNFGLYTFSTSDIFTEINSADKQKSALDLINVVPNPYYAYSTYETGRIDNRIRITNLPNKCKIKIFTLNGTLVRTFDRDVSGQEDVNSNESDFIRSKRLSYQDWDLKNQSGISVASGLYIIHIDVPGVGEKILKWFGVMRPLDLQSY